LDERFASIPDREAASLSPRAGVTAGLGVVIIGRNEGERLRLCLQSLREWTQAAVYVDSGSTDGSTSLARSMGFEVIELDPSTPFTAARGRNAGAEWLRRRDPDLRFVQFVDGDCEMNPGWIAYGLSVLTARQDVAVVFGHVRERHPDASVFNRLCDMEWNVPIGEADGCGGIALMRLNAFLGVGGFDLAIIAGEDTELCARLRAKGYLILHVDADMVRHDAAMMRAGQWWQRAVRAGYGAACCASLPDGRSVRQFVVQVRSAWLWGCLLPATALLLAWPTYGCSLIILMAYPLLALRVYRGRSRQGAARYDAGIYALHCVFAKLPKLVGVLRYHSNQLRERPNRIIEYKGPGPDRASDRLSAG
jgi:hypothetical protein